MKAEYNYQQALKYTKGLHPLTVYENGTVILGDKPDIEEHLKDQHIDFEIYVCGDGGSEGLVSYNGVCFNYFSDLNREEELMREAIVFKHTNLIHDLENQEIYKEYHP